MRTYIRKEDDPIIHREAHLCGELLSEDKQAGPNLGQSYPVQGYLSQSKTIQK